MKILNYLLVIFFPMISLAIVVSQTTEQMIASAQRAQAAWHTKNDGQIDQLKKAIESRKKQLQFCQTNYADDPSCGASSQSNEVEKLNTSIRAMEGTLGALDKQLDEINKQIKAGTDKSNQEKSAAAEVKRAQETAEVARLQANLAKTGLEMVNLKFGVSDLGRDIDKMQIGQYVAAKMALMLNSQPFCDSMKRCAEPKGQAKNRVTAEQMKEIFPGLNADIFKNTDFWQAARSNRPATPAGAQ